MQENNPLKNERDRRSRICKSLSFFGGYQKRILVVGDIQVIIDGEVDGGGHLRVVVGVVPYRDAAAARLLADQREVVAAAVEGVVAAEVDKTVAASKV